MFAPTEQWQIELDKAFTRGQAEYLGRWERKDIVTTAIQVGVIVVGNHERTSLSLRVPTITAEVFDHLRDLTLVTAKNNNKRPVVLAFNCQATPEQFIVSVTVDLFDL